MTKKVIAVFVIWAIFALLLICDNVFAYEYTAGDIVDIAKVIYHEAGNQSDYGMRLVCDTILNRVDDERFPNTAQEVLSQKGQYCRPRKYPPKWMYSIVAQEIYNRTNSEVLWYKTKNYHSYGTPLLVEGNHYFSGGK